MPLHFSKNANSRLQPGLPRWRSGKESACHSDARDAGSILGSGRSSREGHGNPLQYSCLENSMDRGAWRATVYGVAKSQTRLSTHTPTDFNLESAACLQAHSTRSSRTSQRIFYFPKECCFGSP